MIWPNPMHRPTPSNYRAPDPIPFSLWRALGPLLGSLIAGALLVGCGASIDPEQAKMSAAQYDLAVGLHGEGNTPGAFQALKKAIALDPNNSDAYLFLGSLYLLIRDDDPELYDKKAEENFREVIKIQSGEHAPRVNLAAEARNMLGVLYAHQKRYKEAGVILEKAVADLYNPHAYLAWGNLGWVYGKMEKYKKAIRALQRSIQLQPRFCVGYFRLGEVRVAMQQLEKAEAALTSAIEVDERCELIQEAWQLRGEVRAKMGEREAAIADLERCVELNPDTEAGRTCSRLLESAN